MDDTPPPSVVKDKTNNESNAPSTTPGDSDVSHTDVVAERINLIASYLKSNSLYIGVDQTRDNVVWMPENRGHRLVERTATSEKKTAVLTVITTISNDDFFLTPDASYKGRTNFNSSLADVKLSCVGRRPMETDLIDEFAHAVRNVSAIMDQVHTLGLPRVGVTMPPGSTTPTALKFRHVLFKDVATANVVLPEDAPSTFHIANWPVYSPSARKELELMRHTHAVVPLPAYDFDGNLITPLEYRNKLKGAVAVVRFDLLHWAFPAREGRPASDTYVANIHRIDVLRNPITTSDRPTKHVLDMHDPLPSYISLAKRRKID